MSKLPGPATRSPGPDVTALATELRVRNQDQAAYQLCLHALVNRPAAIQELVAALREEGRPVDARKPHGAWAPQAWGDRRSSGGMFRCVHGFGWR